MNFLEQLASEWLTFQGYFVRSNVRFEKRTKGGWSGEIDVAGFHPETRELVHMETSMDADSWTQRRKKFERKFAAAKSHYERLFPGFEIKTVRRVAVVGTSERGQPDALGGDIEVRSLPEFIRQIEDGLRPSHPMKNAVPENLPLLRTAQFLVHWGARQKG